MPLVGSLVAVSVAEMAYAVLELASVALELASDAVVLHPYTADTKELVLGTTAAVGLDKSAVAPAEVLFSTAAPEHEKLLAGILVTDYHRWDNREPDVQVVHNENMPQSPCSTAQ